MTQECVMQVVPVDERRQRHDYFVDEAGDLTLFGRRGRVLVGQPGCSRYFMLGVALLPDPDAAAARLASLRTELLADPYFRGVPSMQAESRKTALYFHANDDLPEVRREVFNILPSFHAKVQVAIRTKSALVEQARKLSASGLRLGPSFVYDDLVKRLFRNLLHKADSNHIVFAWRGKSSRKEALEAALAKAKRNFHLRWGKREDKPVAISSEYSHACAGLQVVDYYLWALQRLYERREDRYFELLRTGCRLIMDLDDTRNKPYGEWYTDQNPLGLRRIKAF